MRTPLLRLSTIVLTTTLTLTEAAMPPRPFTVQDSIELATFLLPGSQYGMASPVTYSPDSAHFVVGTLRGNVGTGKRDATLWLFETRAVRSFTHSTAAPPGPTLLARISSSSNHDPLGNWRWSSDSRSVLFLGADDEGITRLYRSNIDHPEPTPLSRPDQDVSRFDEKNGVVAYLAHAPLPAGKLYDAGSPTVPDMEVATGKNVIPLLFPDWMSSVFHESVDGLWIFAAGISHQVGKVQLKGSALAVSPDGKHVLVTPQVEHIPKSWERYRPLQEYPGFDIIADTPDTEGATDYYRPRRYEVIDSTSGEMAPVLDAPIQLLQNQSSATVQWSSDGSRIALLGPYPALTPAQQTEPGRTVMPCAVMIADLRTKTSACAQSEPISDYEHDQYNIRKQITAVSWIEGDRAIKVEYAAPKDGHTTSITLFTPTSGGWKARNLIPRPAADGLTVNVHQSLDEPPVLQAASGRGEPRTLLDPNPQLKDIAAGTAELYTWHDQDGDTWSGALVKPPGFNPKQRYPLVIQTHGLDRTRYLVDGPSATGFAARALAARNILVLQVDEIKKNDGNPRESESGAAGYRSAINQLVAEGHVDSAKVGIITWSHMGPYAMQGLIDTPRLYAAATFAEAAYNGYGEYLMNIDYMGAAREKMFRAQYGSKPFGKGLSDWLGRNAAFRTDQVCAPVLFQINSPPALVYTWDSYAALRAQQKPVDLFYIRGGDHVLVKPAQRLAEQGMNVDWFDYWLNGHRDPDSSKNEQYKRWDGLKSLVECPSK